MRQQVPIPFRRKLFVIVMVSLAIKLGLWLAVYPSPALAADPGDLDTTFGTGGVVTTTLSTGPTMNTRGARGVAIQDDGHIVVAGYSYHNDKANFGLTRYEPNGNLDSGFGSSGIVTTAIQNDNDYAEDIAIQNDGKIVVAGSAYDNGADPNFALARYNSDGSLDSAFGISGIVTTSFNTDVDFNQAVAIQSDGKIVSVGLSYVGNGRADIALARYHSDGSLDLDFGTDGKVTTSLSSGDDYGMDVALQTDGKIVVAGRKDAGASTEDFALVRYNSDGSLDSSFGTGGKVITSISNGNDWAYELALQPDGKIVVVGAASFKFALARYNLNGSLDTNFGVGGIVTTTVSNNWNLGLATVIQADGKIVLGGNQSDSNSTFTVIRYNPDGALDANFGDGGIVATPSGSGLALALQSDGRIVVAGATDTNSDFTVVRYLGDPIQVILTGGVTSITEGEINDTYQVRLSDQPSDDVTVNIEHDPQLALSEDSLLFTPANWDDPQTVTITTLDDNIYEVTSTGLITHTATSDDPDYSNVYITGVKVQVMDNDNLPTLTVADATLDEGSGASVFTVTLTGQSAFPAGVNYTISNGSAVNGQDYHALNGVLNWPAEQPGVRTAPIMLFNDTLDEPDETVLLTLSNPISATILDSSGVLTITDNDPPPNLSITKTVTLAQSPVEPGDPLTYTIVLAGSGSDVIGVTINDILPEYIEGPDLSQTVNLAANQSLTFTIQATIAGDAPYGLTITNIAAYSHTSGSGQAAATFTIVADTTPPAFPLNPLITPTGNITVTTGRPVFDWLDATDSQSGVVSYMLVITGDNETLALQDTTLITTNQSIFTPTVNLPIGAYTWTVRAHDAAGNASPYASPAESFVIGETDQSIYLPMLLKGK